MRDHPGGSGDQDKQAQLEQALQGLVGPRQRLLLSTQLRHIDFLDREIETLSAEIAELTEAAFSTISVNLVETALAARTVNAPSWRGVWRRAGETFVQVSNAVLVFAAGLVVFLAGLVPVLIALLAAGAGWAVWRLIRRGRTGPPMDAGRPS